MTTHHIDDLHNIVTELTRTTVHRERYTTTETGRSRHHITTVPSLVDQLHGATPASQASDGSSPGFGSRPAARVEALDTLLLIDREAAAWVRRLGHDDPGDTTTCIRRVYALRANATTCTRTTGHRDPKTNTWCCPSHHIEHDLRHWWHQARIISGWDSPAWRPDNTCLVCNERRSLRIKLATHTAVCVQCRSVWQAHEIGLLAEHIRAENADTDSHATDTPAAS